MQWLKYAYCLFFLLFTFGNIITWLFLRRNRGASLPDAQSHDGSPLSSDDLFFVEPPPEIGILRSVQTTLTKNERPRVKMIILGMTIGALIGFGATWSFGVTASWLVYSLVGLTAILSAYFAFELARPHHCSFVGVDGIYDVAASVTRNATSVTGATDTQIPFDMVTDIYVRPDVSLVFILAEKNWEAPYKEGCFHRVRPQSVSAADWNAFQHATKAAFDEHLWSRALLQLAVSKLIDRKDPDVDPEAGWRAMLTASISESGFRPNEGLYQPDESGEFFSRLGCGNITFNLDSLLIYARDADVFEAKERPALEVARDQIKRVSIEDGKLCVDTASDGTLKVAVERCSRASVLVRLIQSSIWTEGIEAQIAEELQQDIDTLKLADWMNNSSNVPYWTIIPAHRYAIWHAAQILKLPSLDSNFAERLKSQTGYGPGNPCNSFWVDYADQFSGWRLRQSFEREMRQFRERKAGNVEQEEKDGRFVDTFLRQLAESGDPGTPPARLESYRKMLRRAEMEADNNE